MTINIALTGPPSAGKTSVIKELNQMLKNVNIYQEISREIIQRSLETGSDVLPWENAQEFDRAVVNGRNKDYLDSTDLMQTQDGHTIKIYDRSALDTYAYSKKFDCLEEQTIEICKQTNFDAVFFFPLVEKIFTHDEQRKESIELARELEDYLMITYTEFNQPIAIVEFDTIQNRALFIIEEIERRFNLTLDRQIN